MALIVCPECNKEISDMAAVCPNCGYPLKESETSLNETTSENSTLKFTKEKLKNMSDKTKKIVAGAFAILVVILIALFGMNANERLALKACKDLKSILKDPNSFILYDDIAIYTGADTSKEKCMAIDYGAANSYGGMVRNTAIFCKGKYLGDMGDGENDFDTLQEYDEFLLAELPYKVFCFGGTWNDSTDMKFVSSEKIMKKLK